MFGKAVYTYALVILNIVFVIAGAALLSVCLFVKYDDDGLANLLTRFPEVSDHVKVDELVSSSIVLLIAAGTFMFLVGFFGCCGAWKEIKAFLVIYAATLGMLFILQLVVGLLAVFLHVKYEDKLHDELRKSLQGRYKHGFDQQNGTWVLAKDMASLYWDLTQMKLACCGVEGPQNYDQASSWNGIYHVNGTAVNAKVPISCCKLQDPEDFPHDIKSLHFDGVEQCLRTGNENVTNTQGCFDAVEDLIKSKSNIVIGVVVAIGLVEILAVILAVLLCRALKKDDYKEL